MGTRGPIPKRSDQRRRTNKPARPVKTAPSGSGKGKRPPCKTTWHQAARQWYLSLDGSGQSEFYEPSDWALAYLLAESISRELKPHPLLDAGGRPILDAKNQPIMLERPPKGAALTAWLKGMTMLLVSESDRRRLQIELHPPAGAADLPKVSSLDAWRSRTDGTG